ncbi:DUF3800 domain-containing protein [Chromobacterium vaccinii]|uniref:DUF3800 domain-containing protein n=1 Tax=Chromobacterium vaccinii TaxID=1108595 RepID=UPI0031D8FFA6
MEHEKEVPQQASDSTAVVLPTQAEKFSKYIVYVDESGDHGMQTLDAHYPVFVLAFCVFHKQCYNRSVIPALNEFKFKHFGHNLVVLHEHEIRKEKGEFRFVNRPHKQAFLDELTAIIESSRFMLISCVIDKAKLRDKIAETSNPYHLALGFCLETLYELLQEKSQHQLQTHIVVECRGKKEDQDLELEFRRICAGNNHLERTLPFEIIFADKKSNSVGLQLADLVARPIGTHILRPEQPNRAFEVLRHKFYCSGGRNQTGQGYENWGLKVYPRP